MHYTEMKKFLCTWLGEVCYSCSLTVLPGPAWVVLNHVLQRIFFTSVEKGRDEFQHLNLNTFLQVFLILFSNLVMLGVGTKSVRDEPTQPSTPPASASPSGCPSFRQSRSDISISTFTPSTTRIIKHTFGNLYLKFVQGCTF